MNLNKTIKNLAIITASTLLIQIASASSNPTANAISNANPPPNTNLHKLSAGFQQTTNQKPAIKSTLKTTASHNTSNTSSSSTENQSTHYSMASNLIKLITKLKLTPQQNQDIQKTLSSHQTAYNVINTKIDHTKFILLSLPANATRAQLKTLAQAQSNNIKQLIQLRSEIKQQVSSILNKQQQQQLTQQWEEFQQTSLNY